MDRLKNLSQGEPLISVVICTRNRADYLSRAIRSVVEQGWCEDKYEVIVVNNGSTDRTREVVRSFELKGHRVRHEFEGTVGLCHARNTGWLRARGRYVAYLDDDAVACPGWLAAIDEAFATTPGIGVVGGRVDPIWEGDRPRWLSDEIRLCLTILNWSDQPMAIDIQHQWLAGANMAVPRSVFVEVGGFHPGLDRVDDHMAFNGDVFLQKQFIRRGYTCLYYPKMAARHLVPNSRLKKSWFIRRCYFQGLSDAAMRQIEDAPSWRQRLRLAFSMAAGLFRSPRRIAILILPSNNPARFKEKCFSFITVGHIAGLLGLRNFGLISKN
jgi:glucosyl-dolichyl phosphate glucuronosyltransferase